MAIFVIEGGNKLSGSLSAYGSKNAALPLLAASLLTSDTLKLDNIPAILDVKKLISILKSLGVEVSRSDNAVTLTAGRVDPGALSNNLVGELRGSILLMGALLGRNKKMQLPRPGGDVIGARPIDVHLDAFTQLGAHVDESEEAVIIDGERMKAGVVVMREFSVTATENVLLTAAKLPGETTIHIAAAEPHVVALAELLNAMGANIEGAGTHTITVQGQTKLGGATYTNIPDMLEAGFFILLGAVTQSELVIENVPVDHLRLFFKKLDDINVSYTVDEEAGRVIVHPSKLRAFKMQSLPHPGIATDLQAPFAVMATQASGSSLIHDPMYEDRFKHIAELKKMGARAVVCDPHRVVIEGPTKLAGKEISSLDIRSGATLVMAGLVAHGQTIIHQAEIIERGYADLTKRLQKAGAIIARK
ncbi:MAG: UDP-N-acetylglucosamine 1-carboxyvinyltransferase [bacterium]